MSQKQNNIPVSMDDAFLAELDAVAADVKDSRSSVMRRAIRAGLPLVKSGGAADVLTLDSESSKEADALASGHKRTRHSVLLEAIRHGIRAVDLYAMLEQARREGTPEGVLQAMEASHDLDAHPEKRAVKKAIAERAAFWIQVEDLVNHVPQARERKEAIERLIELRRSAKDWPSVWGRGLSTEEVKWQVAMHEKFGPDAAKWPKAEIDKRETERQQEQQGRAVSGTGTAPEPKRAKKKSSK
ncbi:MAG: hypothetical protein MUF81_04020 [Verrucomicrobia bacterium]|nr:hypothetical protein [Verrucomicrobiota bacterium]